MSKSPGHFFLEQQNVLISNISKRLLFLGITKAKVMILYAGYIVMRYQNSTETTSLPVWL